MEPLKLAKTDDTPEIILDKENGIFEISGRSLPEDSMDFFLPVFQWLAQYQSEPNNSTEFVLKLDYANTASSKMIQDILSALEKIRGVTIVWYHFEDDEDMIEMGHEFSELADIPFIFKTY